MLNGLWLKTIMIDFTIANRPKMAFPYFQMTPQRINKYMGIVLKRRDVNIIFPRIEGPVGINIFNQLYPSETHHSKVLGELLSPKGKHEKGNLFLKMFFRNILMDIPFNNNETWVVTTEQERYDVRIRNIDYSTIIILENKSNKAGDQPNQLYRYWYNGIYRIQSKLKTDKIKYGKILYISPDYNKQPDEQTKQPGEELTDNKMTIPKDTIKTIYFHDEIDKWLEDCLNAVECKSDIFYYLKQYKEFWRFYYGV
jgi:hypothetical protein